MQGLGGREAHDSDHFSGHKCEEGSYAEVVPRSWGHLSMAGCHPRVAYEVMKPVAVVAKIQALLGHKHRELSFEFGWAHF